MWRSVFKGRTYSPFFDMVKQVYPLHQPPNYTYTEPLFDSWAGVSNRDKVEPLVTDGDTESETEAVSTSSAEMSSDPPTAGQEVQSIVISSDSEPSRPTCSKRTAKLLSELFSDSSGDEEGDKTITPIPPPRPRRKPEKTCHPKGFKPVKDETSRPAAKKKKHYGNPYSASNFVYDWSSDDDFVASKP